MTTHVDSPDLTELKTARARYIAAAQTLAGATSAWAERATSAQSAMAEAAHRGEAAAAAAAAWEPKPELAEEITRLATEGAQLADQLDQLRGPGHRIIGGADDLVRTAPATRTGILTWQRQFDAIQSLSNEQAPDGLPAESRRITERAEALRTVVDAVRDNDLLRSTMALLSLKFSAFRTREVAATSTGQVVTDVARHADRVDRVVERIAMVMTAVPHQTRTITTRLGSILRAIGVMHTRAGELVRLQRSMADQVRSASRESAWQRGRQIPDRAEEQSELVTDLGAVVLRLQELARRIPTVTTAVVAQFDAAIARAQAGPGLRPAHEGGPS